MLTQQQRVYNFELFWQTNTMEAAFDYRFYKKKSKYICFRSADEERHFTLLWCDKNSIDREAWDSVNFRFQEYLAAHDWTLTFTPWKACNNCTYGHFDAHFEAFICQMREEFPQVDTSHDLTFDGEHAHLLEEGCPVPLFAHISHSRGANEELNKFLQTADPSTELTIHLTVRKKRSD